MVTEEDIANCWMIYYVRKVVDGMRLSGTDIGLTIGRDAHCWKVKME